MTRHKFVYEYEGDTILSERYPQQKMVIESKCDDLDAHELLQLFKSYMLACGYAEKSFYNACEEAAEESPYRSKGRDRYELGQTNQGAFPVKENYIKELLS